MCRMLGVMCNDADLLGCAMGEVSASLELAEGQGHHGVGVGYYSADDPLLKRRPSDPEEGIDYAGLTEDIQSNTLLVHVRRATVGAWKSTNTHPFRFRRWLFAHVGHLPALDPRRDELTTSLPPFLARNIAGETDSELAFHLFLDSLFKDGTLNDLTLTAERLAGYMRTCVERIAKWHEGSQDEPTYAIAVTNGQVMGAICRGEVVHYSHREGIHACEDHTEDEHQRQSHGRFKGIMIGAQMSDPGHQWREVTDGSLLTVSRALELKVEQI